MFRTIHPNRWFFWAIAAVIGLSLFLLWSIQEAGKEFEEGALAGAQPSLWKTYSSQALGLSVHYPPSWQIEFDPARDAHSFSLENPKNFGENIVFEVTDPKLEKVLRSALKIASEKPVEIDGAAGTWITNADKKDGLLSNVILIKLGSRLYYIAGSGRNLERIIDSVKFTGL